MSRCPHCNITLIYRPPCPPDPSVGIAGDHGGDECPECGHDVPHEPRDLEDEKVQAWKESRV